MTRNERLLLLWLARHPHRHNAPEKETLSSLIAAIEEEGMQGPQPPKRVPMTDDKIHDLLHTIHASATRETWVNNPDYFLVMTIRATEKHHGIE